MNNNYSFKSTLEQAESLIGKHISIDAVLVIHGGDAYLVESVEDPQSPKKIPVNCPELELKLDLQIGGWMGGSYSYIDPVRIFGRIENGTTRKNKLMLSNVTELTMIRDDESIRILL
ncbi:MAG: hypothetical protein Q4G70_11430 [Pseudomonadota bacterium]|nr:hypothetical protein [Pseudomonadota bacterium]